MMLKRVYGKPATEFLVQWTNAGDLTFKTFKDGKGKYGRILGELWFGGTHNINQILVDNHAVRYHGQSKEEMHGQSKEEIAEWNISCHYDEVKLNTNVPPFLDLTSCVTIRRK